MPIGPGLSPQTSDVTIIFGRKKSMLEDLKNAPTVEIGPMSKEYKSETKAEAAKTNADYAESTRRTENKNDPVKRGLANIAENALKLVSPSTYIKAAGGSDDMGEVADYALPGFGELKLAAVGSVGAKDLLKYLGKTPKVTILSKSGAVTNARLAEMAKETKLAKEASDKFHSTPVPYSQQKGPPEINGSKIMGKNEEIANISVHKHTIGVIDAFFESIAKDRAKKATQEQVNALARIRIEARQALAEARAKDFGDDFELRPYIPKGK